MLPILPNFTSIKIDPIINLFANTKSDDEFMLGFLLFSIITTSLSTIAAYKKKEKAKAAKKLSDDMKKQYEDSFKQLLKFSLIVMPIVFLICFGSFALRHTAKKEANTYPLETVFNTYSIYEIEKNHQKEEYEQSVVYDSSGNIKSGKTEVLFKVYLKKRANNTAINKNAHIDMIFHNFVELDVIKVNKSSFDILLPDGKVVTIKEKDAKGVFKTLKKINSEKRGN